MISNSNRIFLGAAEGSREEGRGGEGRREEWNGGKNGRVGWAGDNQ